jgi:hypothetical protein
MKKNIFIQRRTILITMLTIMFSINFSYSQTGINFDFALGNFNGWKGYQGVANGTQALVGSWTPFNDPTTVTWQGSPCFVINNNLNEYDPQAGGTNVKKIPTGYTKSTQINCAQNMYNSSRLTYDLLINDTNCLLTFNYAMVLQEANHGGYIDPYFRIEVLELDALENPIGLIDPCATFEVPGRTPVPVGWGETGDVMWQNWRQISMNLRNYLTQKVRISIIISDCDAGGHWAYGYFVGRVGPSALTVNACGNGDTAAVITAPSGFQKYEWYRASSAGMTEAQMAAAAATGTIYSNCNISC